MNLFSLTFFCFVWTFLVQTVRNERILPIDVHQDERIRLECQFSTKTDADEAIWMRIRSPYNPDVLTYRDTVVYGSAKFHLEQRRISSSLSNNGSLVDSFFSTLSILKATVEDEGRYVCTRARHTFAEYDIFIIVPPYFIDEQNHVQYQTIIEGSTLKLSCSASGRPKPSISWYYRTASGRTVLLSDKDSCLNNICDLQLANYTRNDPSLIECIADNKKSTRISRIFHIDVQYPPKLTTQVRALIGIQNTEISIYCSSPANPPASITWLDDNELEINHQYYYTVQHENQTSILTFVIHPSTQSKVLYFCRSNNSLGTVEKLINISEFIRIDQRASWRTSTTATMTTLKPWLTKRSSTKRSGIIHKLPSRLRSTTSPMRIVLSNSNSNRSSLKIHFILVLLFFFTNE